MGEGESDEEECVTVSEVFSPWSVGNRSCSKAIHPFSHTVRVIRALIIHKGVRQFCRWKLCFFFFGPII